MDSLMTPECARALLEWQVELGVDEAMADAPVDRYALGAAAGRQTVAAVPHAAPAPSDDAVDPVAAATAAAAQAADLPALATAMAAYPHCELRRGARRFVFADGNPAARVMIVGEAPGNEEDREGRPFVGPAGQLLDRMFAAIGLSRTSSNPATAVYITNVLPWRPPSNRTPEQAEIAMMLPFLRRHITLAAPEVIVMMGNTPCQALLGRAGITRIRGEWTQVLGLPALPMVHPAYLLRQQMAKREAWADLLSLRARLEAAR
ncbi:MAG: uracil-DNA glycosylase [Rhodobacterales bacterium]|nr:uracil-DNA glycosylase [Rhodobacterales bacterium]NCT11253.1 uracil-DNA glycosylase [Rhodobacterales bacterium]